MWALYHPIRIGGFEWRIAAASWEIDWFVQTDDQTVQYFIEASIHYLVELHDAL